MSREPRPGTPGPPAATPAPAGPPPAAESWTPDHGASAERTRLAWRRTGLSATTVALLAARAAFVPRVGAATVLLTALAMAGWAALIALAYRRAHGLEARPPRPGRRTVVAYALITIGFAVIGGLVVTV